MPLMALRCWEEKRTSIVSKKRGEKKWAVARIYLNDSYRNNVKLLLLRYHFEVHSLIQVIIYSNGNALLQLPYNFCFVR